MKETTELLQKLGLNIYQSSCVLRAQQEYKDLIIFPLAINSVKELVPDLSLDWLQAFYSDASTLEKEINVLKNSISKSGQIWISWPKKSSKIESDLNDVIVRQIGLKVGLVDVKILSINETWSGLKFVYRVIDR